MNKTPIHYRMENPHAEVDAEFFKTIDVVAPGFLSALLTAVDEYA